MAPVQVPNIADLNPAQQDYVAKLDDGYRISGQIGADTFKRLQDLYSVAVFVLMNELTPENIGGRVKAQCHDSMPSVPPLHTLDIIINSEDGNNKALRKAEDLLLQAGRKYRADRIPLEDTLIAANRAREDYSSALNELTEVKPLTPPDPDKDMLYFYIVRPDGVYEASIELRQERYGSAFMIVPPSLNPSLPVELFSRPEIGVEFGQNPDVQAANVYLVTNPSAALSHRDLLLMAVKIVSKEVAILKRRANEEEPTGTVVQRLGRTIKRALGL